MASKYADLLQRVKAATGPDRTLSRDLSREFGLLGHPTASVDDALALVERMLPGWWLHGLGRSPLHGLWWCQLYSLDNQKAAESEDINTAPLAILAALLQALEAIDAQS